MRKLRTQYAELRHALVQQQLAQKDQCKQQVAAAQQYATEQQHAASAAAQHEQLATKQFSRLAVAPHHLDCGVA
jgi:hypothetical protein